MVKSYFILFALIILTNCKNNIKKDVSSKNEKHLTTIKKVENDTINLLHKSKSLNLINIFFSSNIISINDSIYINNNYLAPFYGSNKSKTSFSKYSTLLEIKENKFRIELAKDFKTTHISLGRCNIINDELSERIEEEFNYVTEYSYLIDGGETQLWKLYCTKDNLIVLGFNKYANIASINCNYKDEELPLFFRDVFITEKENYKKGFLSLSFNFSFKDMLEKINSTCE